MKILFRFLFVSLFLLIQCNFCGADEVPATGLRGETKAVQKARTIVDAMGGKWLWFELRSIHFRHRWWYVGSSDVLMESEHLDLEEPRSLVEVWSEIYSQRRVYSPETGWILRNGVFRKYSDEELKDSVAGAAGNIYRIVRRIAREDPTMEVRLNGEHRLDFYNGEGTLLCWISVHGTGEPVLWGTPSVEYVFGPLTRYGSMRLPAWGAYSNGVWRYEMIDAEGGMNPPKVSYSPPAEHQE